MQTSLRCLSRLRTAQAATSSAALTAASRHLTTLELEDEETQWRHKQEGRYGEGNFPLFRALYKEVCDEVRREFYTKPPPPFTEHVSRMDSAAANPSTEARADLHEGEEDHPSTNTTTTAATAATPLEQPAVTYGDGSWRIEYRPENNVVLFHREAVKATRMGRVVAYARVAVQDPPRLNAMLTFADWYPFEVLIERKGVVAHYAVACNEGGMHMRNCRVYEASALSRLSLEDDDITPATPATPASSSASPTSVRTGGDAVNVDALMGGTDDAEWVRQNLLYDGPCLWHLELSFQNELYDVMQDHGIDLEWLRWASEWVFYLEHVMYTRWCVGMLNHLIPAAARGPEEDFLLAAEQELLDEPAEDWLAPHAM